MVDLRELEHRAVDFCSRLIRTKSFSGEEREAIQLVAAEMRALGYHSVKVDQVGNVVGSIHGESPGNGKVVLFDSHADTVGVADVDLWTQDPFGGKAENGLVYGRGACDMKGAIASMVYAGAHLASQGFPVGTVHICVGVSEEIIEGTALSPVLVRHSPDFVVIGEPSMLNLVTAQRGRIELLLETLGVSSHSSAPEYGVNAVDCMIKVIPQLYNLPIEEDDIVGPGILALTGIISSPYPPTSVVPSRCVATFDRRLTTREHADEVVATLRSLAREISEGGQCLVSVSPAFAAYESYTGHKLEGPKVFPAWRLPPEHHLFSLAGEALKSAGIAWKEDSYRFCTNGSASQAMGIPTIGFGPGDPAVAHTRDESIEVRQIHAAMRGYIALATELTAGSRQMRLF